MRDAADEPLESLPLPVALVRRPGGPDGVGDAVGEQRYGVAFTARVDDVGDARRERVADRTVVAVGVPSGVAVLVGDAEEPGDVGESAASGFEKGEPAAVHGRDGDDAVDARALYRRQSGVRVGDRLDDEPVVRASETLRRVRRTGWRHRGEQHADRVVGMVHEV